VADEHVESSLRPPAASRSPPPTDPKRLFAIGARHGLPVHPRLMAKDRHHETPPRAASRVGYASEARTAVVAAMEAEASCS